MIDWNFLIARIRLGKCTPFLGAGAPAALLPTGRQIAGEWADEFDYPYPDRDNLSAIAQFLTDSTSDSAFAKRRLAERIGSALSTHGNEPLPLYETLAQLPFAVYVTTNYDDLISSTLRRFGKEPMLEVCPWNGSVREHVDSILATGYEPTDQRPLVYHLHGHVSLPESFVLTDDDYLDFLLAASRDRDLIPPVVQAAIAGNSLLFVGYRLYDWNFRMIFRRFAAAALQRMNFAVLPPDSGTRDPGSAADTNVPSLYLQQVAAFRRIGIQLFEGTGDDFALDLRRLIQLSPGFQ